MLSSPFSPVAGIPKVMQWLSVLSPYTAIFEYVRNNDSQMLLSAFKRSIVWLGVGIALLTWSFRRLRKQQGLAKI